MIPSARALNSFVTYPPCCQFRGRSQHLGTVEHETVSGTRLPALFIAQRLILPQTCNNSNSLCTGGDTWTVRVSSLCSPGYSVPHAHHVLWVRRVPPESGCTHTYLLVRPEEGVIPTDTFLLVRPEEGVLPTGGKYLSSRKEAFPSTHTYMRIQQAET